MDLKPYESNFTRVALPKYQPQPAQKKKSPGGLAGIATNFLPTIGGAVGAVGGSFVAPGVGTAAGGAVGAGLGEYLRQKITGEDEDGVDIGNIVQEGGLGALPGVFKGAKAVKVAKASEGGLEAAGGLRGALTGGKFGKAVEEVIPAGKFVDDTVVPMKGVEQVTGKGIKLTDSGIVGQADDVAKAGKTAQSTEQAYLSRSTKPSNSVKTKANTKAQQMEAKAGGFGIGAKQPGSAPLDFAGSERVSRTLANEGIKTGSAANRVRATGVKLESIGNDLQQRAKAANRPFSIQDRSRIAQEYLDEVDNMPGVDDAMRNEAENFAANFIKQGKDLEKGISFKRGLDSDYINYVANPDAATATKQQAAVVFRRTLNNTFNNIAPDLADLNTRYSDLTEAKGFLVGGAKNPKGFNIFGNKVGGEFRQAAESFVGGKGAALTGEATAQNAATKAPSFLGRTAKAAGALGAQQGVRIGADMFGMGARSPQGSSEDLAAEYAADPTNPRFLGVDPAQFGYPEDTTVGNGSNAPDMLAESSNGLPSLEQVQKYIASGGKIDDVAKYVALAEKLGYGADEKKKGRNSAASGVIADTKTGLKALSKLSTEIEESGANAPLGLGWLRSQNPLDTEAKNLQTSMAVAKQIVGKALEGGVLRKEDEVKYAKMLPTVNDTDSVARYKLAELHDFITERLTEYETQLDGGDGGVDVSALLTVAQ